MNLLRSEGILRLMKITLTLDSALIARAKEVIGIDDEAELIHTGVSGLLCGTI